MPDKDGKKCLFLIKCLDKSFEISASDKKKKQEWIQGKAPKILKSCQSKLESYRSALLKPKILSLGIFGISILCTWEVICKELAIQEGLMIHVVGISFFQSGASISAASNQNDTAIIVCFFCMAVHVGKGREYIENC